MYARLRALDSRARVQGITTLRKEDDPLIPIGMETDAAGCVTRSAYGVFNLAWQAEQHPEWPAVVEAEVNGIRTAIRAAHKTPLRFLLWCASGAEDKAMYQAAGLLRRGPRLYIIDSTDPVKLRTAFEDIERRHGLSITAVLRSMLVIGVGDGASQTPVMNLEKIANLYERYAVDPRPNFLYMARDASPLAAAGLERGWMRAELQLDNADSVAARHSGPLTRASLYPLALAKADLSSWIAGAFLEEDDIQTAWRLGAFIHAHGMAGRDKLTLLLPRAWAGAGPWTKHGLEESVAKCAEVGFRVALATKPKLANYHSPKDATQDRVFLAVQVKGLDGPDAQKIAALRRAGYPVAVAGFATGATLSRYMQFIHYTAFGLAYLRGVNFGTQPSVDAFQATANCLHSQSQAAGGVERTAQWQTMLKSPRQARHCGIVTLHCDRLCVEVDVRHTSAPEMYAAVLRKLGGERAMDAAELAFFGDTRYSPAGVAVRKVIERAAERIFRARLKMPVDVLEAPAMHLPSHELAGGARCLSTLIVNEKPEQFPAARYAPDHHMAQFLAAYGMLAGRGRPVVAVTLKNLGEESLAALDDFFHRTAACLKARV
ncbi:MAG TPA: hypothetical protein VN428_08555 [Bryobacteraceae bacterium]|nr:hypothetical protein [Bryobacteraceae bacterium]